MLTNLIKYDLKFIFKGTSVFMALLLLSAICFNLTSYGYTPSFLDPATNLPVGGDPDAPIIILFLHTVFYNAVIALLIALCLNSIMRAWTRFRRNMYGDESYLTHTLPVSHTTLWLSKFLSLVITILGVIASIGLSFYILSLTPSGTNLIGNLGFNEHAPVSYTFVLLFGLFIEFVFIGLCGMTGLIIGHRMNNHHMLWSVIWGFVIYSFSAVLLLSFISAWANFDPTLQILFGATHGNHSDTLSSSFITKILFGIDCAYVVMTATLTTINGYLLHRGVNVD